MKNVITKSIILFFILCFFTPLSIIAKNNSKNEVTPHISKQDIVNPEKIPKENFNKPKMVNSFSNLHSIQASYTITDVWWEDKRDDDGDGYTSNRKLYFHVDASTTKEPYYAKIFYKTSSSNSYTLYYTTRSYSFKSNYIFDGTYNLLTRVEVVVGAPNTQLPENIYDFKIKIYEHGSKMVRSKVGPSDFKNLNNKKFEKISEDVTVSTILVPSKDRDLNNEKFEKIHEKVRAKLDPSNDRDLNDKKIRKDSFFDVYNPIIIYSISDTWWSDAKDRDGDGYTRYRRLHFNVDVTSGTYKVYAKIYYKTSSSNSYTLYYTTPPFSITGNKKSDNYWIAVGKPHTQPPRNIYDFKIEIYEPKSNKLLLTKFPSNDSDLIYNKFEKFSEDPFPK